MRRIFHRAHQWGLGLNFDGPESDEVRRFFIENALYWVTDFHIDALRLDAIHAIVDHSAHPLLQELTAAVHQRATELNRRVYVIAESDLNDVRVIQPRQSGGYGFDAQWNDYIWLGAKVAPVGDPSRALRYRQ